MAAGATCITVESPRSPEPDEVLLEYVLDDPTSFCVVVSEKEAFVRVLPAGRKEIENLSQQFVGVIRTKGIGAELSKRLYAMLVQPVPEAATATRFIIAPDAILNLLPFEALRDAHGEYLLKSRVISYVPSGTILNTLRHAENRAQLPNPFLQSVMSSTKTKAVRDGESRLRPLFVAGLSAELRISQGSDFTTSQKREQRLKKSVELLDRTP